MSTETLEEADEYTIELDDDRGVLLFKYTEYVAGENLRDIARRWADAIEAENVERYVVDTSEITAHKDEDKQWLGETWIPTLIDHGVRAGAGVYGDSAIAGMDMEQIEGQLNSIDPAFEYRAFGTESGALEWIADQ